MSLLANIKSAKKRILVTEKKTANNKIKKSAIKTYIRNFDQAIEEGNTEKAGELLKVIDKKLKKAAHRNIIHKNAASRKVSKLTKQLNSAM